MAVIQFPTEPKPSRKSRGVRMVQPVCGYDKLILGPLEFTCPNCKKKIVLSGENLLFRVAEFYCGGCGMLHRVTNPAFSQTSEKTR